MKKNLLILSSSLFVGFSTQAQTWTSANEATVGTSVTMYVVDSNAVDYAALTGAGQTWDYSNLAGYTNNEKIVGVSDPSTGLFSAEFPNSTHSLVIPGFVETFYTFDANEKLVQGFVFEIDGFGDGIVDLSTDNLKALEYPMALGSSFHDDNIEGVFTIGSDSNPAQGEAWVEADGTGTLMLANGVTHTDVIRIRTIDTIYTAIDPGLGFPAPITIARRQYDYMKSSVSSLPLFSFARFDVLNQFVPITFGIVLSTENPTGFVSVTELTNEKELNVYPNPSNGVFTVTVPQLDNATIVVYDAIGKIVKRVVPTSTDTQINISNEPKGMYFVKVSTVNDNKTIKVVVK